MAVYVNNITINTGEYFSRDYYLDNADGTPLDLTGYTASSHVRKHPDSLKPAGIFNVGFINRADGHIRVSLASTATTAIKPGRYVYDVMFTDSSNQKSIVIEGNVLATQDITPSCIVTSYTNEEIGFILEPDGFGSGVSGTEITINDINQYGIVRMGLVSNCGNLTTALGILENETHRNNLINYIRIGGVVWLNGEWISGGCGNQANMNSILTHLGTEIRQDGDIGTGPGDTIRSTDGPVVASEFPSTWHYNATAKFTGGTAVYTLGTDVTAAYEKIGSGLVYVTGDTNTFDPGDYATRGQELYNALRALVLNS